MPHLLPQHPWDVKRFGYLIWESLEKNLNLIFQSNFLLIQEYLCISENPPSQII